MANELLPLSLLILLQLFLGLLATLAVARETGMAWLFSSRGDLPGFRDTFGGRLDRARANGFEALILFAPLCLMLGLSGGSTPATVACAWIFLAARCAYWVCYAANLVPWRTICWFVGWFVMAWMGGEYATSWIPLV